MKCFQCNIEVTYDTSTLHHTKYYCYECYEAVLFAGDLNSESPMSRKNNVKEDEVRETKNVIKSKCPKCKKEYTGAKCTCGFVNPLMRRRK